MFFQLIRSKRLFTKCVAVIMMAMSSFLSGCGGGNANTNTDISRSYSEPVKFYPRTFNNKGESIGGISPQLAPFYPTSTSEPQTLPVPVGTIASQASGLNDLSQIVGWANVNNEFISLYWSSPTAQPQSLLSPPGLVDVTGNYINNTGQIAGSAYDPSDAPQTFPRQKPVFWSSPTAQPQRLALFGDDRAAIADYVCSTGLIIGSSIGFAGRTILWETPTSLPHLLAPLRGATIPPSFGAANNAGLIVGTAILGDATNRAIFWTSSTAEPQTLPLLPNATDTVSSAKTVNDYGVIGGYASTATGIKHAVLWKGNQIYDLNDFLPPHSSWVLTEVDTITNQGLIIARGAYKPTGTLLFDEPCLLMPTNAN